MYHTIESLAKELGVSSLVVQRRAVKLGVWTRYGIADENINQLEFLRTAAIVDTTIIEKVTTTQELAVEPTASENEVDSKLVWYGGFADGKPVYRRADEKPTSKGTVASVPSWSHTIENYTQPEFKVKGDNNFNSIAR